ncbi:MAG: hypothetical protein NZ989_05155 [Bacteroidia bacterium]|nr:hypothetical protein [Bacteroidia bacterium]MDW8057412.1 hypothetical protein [Bacteroidia bacterium]
MAQIDFQSYISLLAVELPRFSIPGVGSFIWHVEKAQVDPKGGVVAPPRPFLKYEPGHRYQAETVAFLQEYFGIPLEEAEALLKEIGRLSSAYLRAANEMDLWKLGKIKKVGAVYKLELAEEAVVPFSAELYEVSLRASGGAAVAPVSPSPESKAKPKEKLKSPSKPVEEPPRARPVEIESIGEASQLSPRSKRRPLLLIGIIILVGIGVAAGGFWIWQQRESAKQPVEIVISKKEKEKSVEAKPSPTPAGAPPPPSSEEPPSAKGKKPAPPPSPEREREPRAEKALSPSAPPVEKPAKPELPKAQKVPPAGPRYHIIIGSYPSRAEAEAKAREFPGYSVVYLPGKDPGWVRLSVFSSSDKVEVQRKLQEIKARVPDAWVLAAP